MKKDKKLSLNGNSTVCYKCGEKQTKKTVGVHTTYQETCDICGQEKICTQLRDFKENIQESK